MVFFSGSGVVGNHCRPHIAAVQSVVQPAGFVGTWMSRHHDRFGSDRGSPKTKCKLPPGG